MIHWLQSLLADYGYWVVGLVVFLNNLGMPVPGDSILLAAGFFAEKGHLVLWQSFLSAVLGCFMGANGGYWVGVKIGYPIFSKLNWVKLPSKQKDHLKLFFEKNGAKAVFFARFVALLHPVTGFLAGTGKIPLRPFLFYNFFGSVAYVSVYLFIGYYFGERWGQVKSWVGDLFLYALLMAAIFIIALLTVVIWRYLRGHYHKHSKKSRKRP